MGSAASSGGGVGNAAAGVPSQLPKPGQHPSGAKSSFVICEICDGYIKDLDQLRSHMQMIHKVKVRGGRGYWLVVLVSDFYCVPICVF